MQRTSAPLLSFAFIFSFSACSEGSFSGGGKKSDEKKPAEAPVKNDRSKKGEEAAIEPEEDLAAGETKKPEPEEGKGGDENPEPGTGGDMDGPVANAIDDAATQPCADKENCKDIVFGPDKVFHIGDGEFKDSTCASEVTGYQVSGKRFIFQFEVKVNDTDVDLKIDKICGVDFADSNYIRLKLGETVVASKLLVPAATSFVFPRQTLSKGNYYLEVESQAGTKDERAVAGDTDDFLIGLIKLKASGAIKPGKVGTK